MHNKRYEINKRYRASIERKYDHCYETTLNYIKKHPDVNYYEVFAFYILEVYQKVGEYKLSPKRAERFFELLDDKYRIPLKNTPLFKYKKFYKYLNDEVINNVLHGINRFPLDHQEIYILNLKKVLTDYYPYIPIKKDDLGIPLSSAYNDFQPRDHIVYRPPFPQPPTAGHDYWTECIKRAEILKKNEIIHQNRNIFARTLFNIYYYFRQKIMNSTIALCSTSIHIVTICYPPAKVYQKKLNRYLMPPELRDFVLKSEYDACLHSELFKSRDYQNLNNSLSNVVNFSNCDDDFKRLIILGMRFNSYSPCCTARSMDSINKVIPIIAGDKDRSINKDMDKLAENGRQDLMNIAIAIIHRIYDYHLNHVEQVKSKNPIYSNVRISEV